MRSAAAAALLAATALVSATTGCSSDASTDSAATSQVDIANAGLIDVRTPAEFASGHLEGADNIDVQSSDFAAKVSQLPKDAPYVVYCRSGNRSAAAIEQMQSLGFTNLLDGGSVQEAASLTGLPVIQ